MKNYPTPWQRQIIWAAVTASGLFLLVAVWLFAIYWVTRALGYLQPLLIPVAVAGILAYLLNPLVEWLCARGAGRTKAVLYVFAIVLLPLVMICIWVVPEIYHQSLEFAGRVPVYVDKARTIVVSTVEKYQQRYADNPYIQETGTWLQNQLPGLPPKIWSFITSSLEGFLGVFGFLLGLIVVPIYLFFFLKDAAMISRRWSDYLPLRASKFKDEVVSCLTEINMYIIAFFRGQILVTLIDGVLIGTMLLGVGLNFALLIGLMVAILQLVPYLGILLCWIPAVLIAAVQWGDWKHPLIVTGVFVLASNLDGLFIAPRIVGNSVGLHPMTIIISVLGWSLLIGGLLGALLAVPLTATLKVLLKRYVWEKRMRVEIDQRAQAPPDSAMVD
ncbi:MAG: AI-2E family transporter [Verrucomicrobiota bacterium]|nr:AI-2E family transporter [Verrucomicrobiota bacterium]